MEPDIATAIERWFTDHERDGEFVRADGSIPFSCIPPTLDSGKLVFTTKPGSVAAALERSASPARPGMIGRYGLPSEEDARWIRQIVGARTLWFLGDMDPVDLLIFAWLQVRLAPITVQHLGVSDRFLAAISSDPPDSFLISLSQSERDVLPLLNLALPDLCGVVGTRCADILRGLRKFEIEAAMHGPHGVAGLLIPLAND